MLVETVDGIDERVNVIAREADLIFYLFPQQGGRSRLYFSFPADQQARFAGAAGPQRFIKTCGRSVWKEWPSGRQHVRRGRVERFRGKTAEWSPLWETGSF